MLTPAIRLFLISQLCLHSLVSSANTPASPSERANLVFDFFAFGRPHRHTKDSLCDRTDWRKKSLKLIKEIPFAGVFRDLHGETKFEASGLVRVNNTYYVVFDSHRSLGVVNDKLEVMSSANHLAGEIGEESQFEGITYKADTETFLVVQESHQHPDNSIKPLIEELELFPNKTSYRSVRLCDLELKLSHENKGIESIQYYDGGPRGKFLFALCEGNFCSGGKKGKESGNGRLIISQLEQGADEQDCRWVPTKIVHVPSKADFQDYAGMAFSGDRFGIVSQEDSALWVSEFDFDEMDFKHAGSVYHFPRDNNCDKVYCTVEGLSWIDRHRVAVTLDRAKADMPFVCTAKDQSMAVFVLPHGA